MKQIYFFFLLVILTFTSVNVKADTTVRIKVDDVSRVTVKVNYVPVVNLVNGVNEVTIPQYGSLMIEAKQGNYLKSVMKATSSGENVAQSISNLSTCNIYVSEADQNILFTVKSGDLASVRTASCTVKVDNATKVRMNRYESQTTVELQNGENIVKWRKHLLSAMLITVMLLSIR